MSAIDAFDDRYGARPIAYTRKCRASGARNRISNRRCRPVGLACTAMKTAQHEKGLAGAEGQVPHPVQQRALGCLELHLGSCPHTLVAT
jgi:hypothetical protein